jgi:hypothetical protein
MKIRLIRLLCAAVPTLVAPSTLAQEAAAPMITTDTLEYCVNLQQMVVQRGSRLPDVKHLLVEGKRMCDHGEIRAGISRLRQALILSRHHPPLPSLPPT